MFRPPTRVPGALALSCLLVVSHARPVAGQGERSAPGLAGDCGSTSSCVIRLGVGETPRPGATSRLTELERDLVTLAGFPGSPLAGRELPVSVGSDYQVYAWLREGAVDAGVVSPPAAYFLERDAIAFPVAELRGEDLETGSRPIFAVAQNGAWSPTPLEALEDLVEALIAAPEDDSTLGRSYTLYMESHLSAPGFMAPLVLIDQRLRRRPLDDEAKNRFWRQLVDIARFAPPTAEDSAEADARTVFVFSSLGRTDEELDAIGALFTPNEACPDGPSWVIYPIVAGEAQPHSLCRSEPTRLGTGSPRAGSYIVPNDVLVLRSEVACRLAGHYEGAPRAGESAGVPEEHTGRGCAQRLGSLVPEAGPFGGGARPGPVRLQPWSRGAQRQFAQQIRRLFIPWGHTSWLHSRYDHWYVEGHYEFTIGELFAFLRDDQARPGNEGLALVLPGGGVKSIYQAGMLDRLYCSGYLANGHVARHGALEGCDAMTGPGGEAGPDSALHVRSVIGTSGGAMVGFLTALQHPGRWGGLSDDVRTTAAAGVFSPFDIPRILSILLLLGILVALLLFMRPTLEELHEMQGEEPSVPRVRGEHALPAWRRVLLAWPLVAFPLAVKATGLGDLETLRAWEGLLYGGLVILVHFVLTSYRQPATGEAERSAAVSAPGEGGSYAPLVRAEARVVALLGATLVLGAIVGSFVVPGSFLRTGLPLSLLASSGIVCLYLGQIMETWGARKRVRVVSPGQYVRGMGFVALALLFAYGVFAIPVWVGAVTHLELTSRFWLVLALVGLAVFGALTVWATAPQRAEGAKLGSVGRWVRDRMLWLGESDDAGSWLTSPGTRLLALGTFGTLLWLGFVVPSLYGNARALEAFREMAARQVHERSAEPGHERHGELLHANLIVTGALLRDLRIADDDRELHEGDFYFCFSGPEGCQTDVGPRWLVGHDPDLDAIVDAVFSSGSPFPVLPAHAARLPDGTRVPLVDGGYAHNIPFEAALLSGARQVLTVHSTPLVDRDATYEHSGGLADLPGRLTTGMGRIFSFLFARAQELDRTRARGMFVASLAPRPADGDGRYPSMTEFTAGTVRRLEAFVDRDFAQDRRIGRVESWGTPVQLRVIHTEE